MLNLFMPVNLITGESCVIKNKEKFSVYGKRCIIITGKNSAKSCGALDDVLNALESESIEYLIFDKISANPLLTVCMEAGKQAADFKSEFVLGIGGGSALDAAKAVSVLASNPDLTEKEFYDAEWPKEPLPIILVGTTSGTGSEVTKVSVLTDSKGIKHSIHHNKMYAAVSFGDPKYTLSLPKDVTISTGIDILAHCTESYFSKKANEISRAMSVKGIQMIAEPLMCAVRGDTLTLEQRETLYEASVIGGLAICVTGTVFPHNVGYYLSENFKVPHGNACAVFIPDLMEYELQFNTEYTNDFYKKCDIRQEEFLALVKSCVPDLDIQLSTETVESIFKRWDNNNSVKSTLGNVTAEDIKSILINKFVNKGV